MHASDEDLAQRFAFFERKPNQLAVIVDRNETLAGLYLETAFVGKFVEPEFSTSSRQESL